MFCCRNPLFSPWTCGIQDGDGVSVMVKLEALRICRFSVVDGLIFLLLLNSFHC